MIITEERARLAIIRWAESYFGGDDWAPAVIVLSLKRNRDEWEAELEVSSSADNPHVTFWIDRENRIHVPIIEY